MSGSLPAAHPPAPQCFSFSNQGVGGPRAQLHSLHWVSGVSRPLCGRGQRAGPESQHNPHGHGHGHGLTRPCADRQWFSQEGGGQVRPPGTGRAPRGGVFWLTKQYDRFRPRTFLSLLRLGLLPPHLHPHLLVPGLGGLRGAGARPREEGGSLHSQPAGRSLGPGCPGGREGDTGGFSRLSPSSRARAGPAFPEPLPGSAREGRPEGPQTRISTVSCPSRESGSLGGRMRGSGTGLSSGGLRGQRQAGLRRGNRGSAGGHAGSCRSRREWDAGEARLEFLEESGGSAGGEGRGCSLCWPHPKCWALIALCIWGPRWALTLSSALL